MLKYQVVVGNVGTVYHGDDKIQALNDFNHYVNESMLDNGRAGNESVVMFEDGHPVHEHQPLVDEF